MGAFSPLRCIAASLAGLMLAGCETVHPQFSTSFNNSDYSGIHTQATLSIPLEASPVSTGLSDPGSVRQLLRPGNPELLETPKSLSSVAPSPRTAPGDALPRVIMADRPLQCVPFARAESGIEIRGNANRWWQLAAGRYSRSKRPEAGSVLVMKGYRSNQRGHVAVVKRVVDERTIVVDHANWGNDGKIHLQAPIRDLSPNNDWSQVQVWFTPANQWGQRVYKTKGFILPTTELAATNAPAVAGSN